MIIDVEKGEVLGNSFYKFEQLDLQKKILIFSNDDKTIDLVKAEIMLVNDISRLDMASLYRKIYGFFSIIILSKESISITSDPYGLIKFYHYAKEKKKFISDNLLDFKGLDLTPDKEAIKYFFITSYTPSKHTFFNEVKKIPPCSINNLSLENGYQIESNLYGDFGPSILEKKDLLEKFKHEMSSSLSFFKKNYKSLEFSLSGGLDSVFLIKLYKYLFSENRVTSSGMKMEGLNSDVKIDNEFDIEFSKKFSKDEDFDYLIYDYDFSKDKTFEDFFSLRNYLGCDYAFATGLVGYYRDSDKKSVKINGQNADSILSFGSMGRPSFEGLRPVGLNGLFSRYFYFFGTKFRFSFMWILSVILRNIYYLLNYRDFPSFSRKNFLLGIGIIPENRFFFNKDDSFNLIKEPDSLKEWFYENYIEEIEKENSDLDDHGTAVLVYMNTYMQGSANRSTVISGLISDRKVFLPFTSLGLLELMTKIKPNFLYSFYGKFPNYLIGKRELQIPSYILDRRDPNDCDSTNFIYSAASKGGAFRTFVSNYELHSYELFKDILHIEKLQCIKGNKLNPNKLGDANLFKILWIDSFFKDLEVSS